MADILDIETVIETAPLKNKIIARILAKNGRRCIIADSSGSCILKMDANLPESVSKKYFVVGNTIKMINCKVKKQFKLLVVLPKTSIFKLKHLEEVVDVQDLTFPEDVDEEDDEDPKATTSEENLASEDLCKNSLPLADTRTMSPHTV